MHIIFQLVNIKSIELTVLFINLKGACWSSEMSTILTIIIGESGSSLQIDAFS